MSSDDIEELQEKIKRARECMRRVQKRLARLAGVLSGTPGLVTLVIEFPDPGIAHVWQGMFGRKVGEPTVYRLSFGKPLKWVGVSHPWGLKPADIEVAQYQEGGSKC
jgi:hypothetical protein